MTRIDWVVVGCLGTLAIPALDEPAVLLVFAPVTVVIAAMAIVGTLRGLRVALPRVLPLGRAAAPRLALCAMIAACLVGAVASLVPVLAVQRHGSFVPVLLSRYAAPALWSVLLVATARALRVPSPRRLATLVVAITAAWPALLLILAMREPFMAIDDRVLVLAPWALRTYAACALATSALALAVGHAIRHACAAPEPVLPPRAEVIDR